jgi:hypothetical protein
MSDRSICIDLFCGLGGWAEGFLAEGYQVIGFDVEARPYPGELVLQDVLTLDGSQFAGAACIVASPPCQEYSYMAMPWSRSKQIQGALESGNERFPSRYKGSTTIPALTALFDACFRIQREASEAAGRYIPMVVENVRGAQPWVGKARAHFGSFYLWGDVDSVGDSIAVGDVRFGDVLRPGRRGAGRKHNPDASENLERLGVKNGSDWFGSGANCSEQRRYASKSNARREASARIAMIPPPLARYVARAFKPAN